MLEWLTQNWFLKLISLVFAVVFWFFVMGEQKLEVGYSVPLELKNLPSGIMVANEVPSLVDVRISGPRTLLSNLRPKDMSIAVDLKDLQPGLTTFKRLEERLDIPGALKVTRLSPSFVDVKLERIKEKNVVVKVRFSGEPAEGFRVNEVKVVPIRVAVEGAESEIKNVNEVFTEKVDIKDVKESFTLMVPVNYEGKYTYLKDQKTVEVQVSIESLSPPAGEAKEGKTAK